jgi:ubiquinone/menaquinone biosynthesis C-methylase UbiE
VLEIGAGSGAMAAELLVTYPDLQLTVTDYDEEMVDAAASRLSQFRERVTARQADATALPFADGSFDVVLSWVMLHHTVEWEIALAEAMRVLRPGGHLVGYDLLSTPPLRLLHPASDQSHRMIRLSELRDAPRNLPVGEAIVKPSLAGLTARFTFEKRATPTG